MGDDVALDKLPEEIRTRLAGMTAEVNDIGLSGASVYRFTQPGDSVYLKIAETGGELEAEYKILLWLQGKLPVPSVLRYAVNGGMDYMLLSEIKGMMLCDDYFLKNPLHGIEALAQGLRLMTSVDISRCPFDSRLDVKLRAAEGHVSRGEVDMDDWDDDNTFESPEALLEFLRRNRPSETLAFTHGDYCLPNILADERGITGFIDFARAGVADIWQDIALCIRSLRYNYETTAYDRLLLEKIGVPLDKDKLQYYILLDELF